MKKAVIIYRFLPHYRLDFYNQLRTFLMEHDVELQLIYGKEKDSSRKDEADLEWATYVPNVNIHFAGRSILWQPCLGLVKGADLVIVEQANKLIVNFLLSAFRKQWGFKFAYWGHGQNLHESPDSPLNRFKKRYLKACDWWFAYTAGVKDYLIENGYDEAKISTVQNAIDTSHLTKLYDSITDDEITSLKKNLKINSKNIGLYCGSLYKGKRLEFMIQACDRVREQMPDFEIILIGSGPDLPLLEKLAATRPWVHYYGNQFGRDKVTYFKMAKVCLMPGVVGLGVLDSFALRTPMITTTYPYHSPEVEYLINAENGIMTDNSVNAFASGIFQVLDSPTLHARLVEGCINTAPQYTNENMVQNFGSGILKAIGVTQKELIETA